MDATFLFERSAIKYMIKTDFIRFSFSNKSAGNFIRSPGDGAQPTHKLVS